LTRPALSEGHNILSRGESNSGYLGPLAPIGGPGTAGYQNGMLGSLNSIVTSPTAGANHNTASMLGRVLSTMN